MKITDVLGILIGALFIMAFIVFCHISGKQSHLHFQERNMQCIASGLTYRYQDATWICTK